MFLFLPVFYSIGKYPLTGTSKNYCSKPPPALLHKAKRLRRRKSLKKAIFLIVKKGFSAIIKVSTGGVYD